MKIESTLELPYKLIDVRNDNEQLIFSFLSFDDGQTDYSIQKGGVTGKFGVSYKCSGIESCFECDITIGNLYYFYIELENVYERLPGIKPVAVLENYGELKRTEMTISCDKTGRWSVSGCFRNKGTGYREMIKYLLRILMLEIARINDKEGRSQNDDKVNRHFEQIVPALRYVDANYAGELKAADLARECNISEVHLRRLFCDCVNLPPMDYVNLVRIQKACDLMQKSNYSMDRVAEECGFSSTSTFNRNFVKFMNNTPYQWKLGKKSGKDRLRDYNILAIQGW